VGGKLGVQLKHRKERTLLVARSKFWFDYFQQPTSGKFLRYKTIIVGGTGETLGCKEKPPITMGCTHPFDPKCDDANARRRLCSLPQLIKTLMLMG